MSWTDKEIDDLFREGSENLSFEYKGKYWDEFNASLPASGSMSGGEGNEIDALYKNSAQSVNFAYKNAYWEEMEAMLPTKKRGDGLWFTTSLLFVGLLLASIVVQFNAGIDTRDGRFYSGVDASTKFTDRVESYSEETNALNNEQKEGQELFAELGKEPTTKTVETLSVQKKSAPYVLSSRPKETQNILTSTASTLSAEENIEVLEQVQLKVMEKVSNLSFNESILPPVIESEEVTNQERLEVEDLELKELESIPTEDNQLAIEDFRLPATKPFMYVDLIGGASQSLITPSDRISSSIGVGIGTQFRKGNFVFTTGVNGIVSYHNDLILTRHAKVYSFGSDIYNYKVEFDQLYTLEANLSVGYNLGKHHISIGVRPSYVLGTKVGYSENVEGDDSGRRNVVYNYMGGMNRFGLKPNLGYAFDITPKWTVGVNIGTQLLKAVNDDFVNGKNNKLPIDGQLFIRRTLNLRR